MRKKSRAFKSPWNFQGRRGASPMVTSSFEVPDDHVTATTAPRSRPITHVAKTRSPFFGRLSLPLVRLIVVTSRYVCHPVLDYAHRTSSGPVDCAPTTLCPLSLLGQTRFLALIHTRTRREIRDIRVVVLFRRSRIRSPPDSRTRRHCPSRLYTDRLTSSAPLVLWRHSGYRLGHRERDSSRTNVRDRV